MRLRVQAHHNARPPGQSDLAGIAVINATKHGYGEQRTAVLVVPSRSYAALERSERSDAAADLPTPQPSPIPTLQPSSIPTLQPTAVPRRPP